MRVLVITPEFVWPTRRGKPYGEHVVRAESDQALAAATVSLLGDDERRRTLARAARGEVETTYSWANTYGRIHGIVEEAVGR